MADRHQRDRELEALRERLSRLSEASAHINGSLDFDTVLQGVLDSARSLTAARYGVMTLFGEGGGIEDFLASGIAPEEAEALWLTPDSLEILEALTETSSPLRVPDLMEHVRSLGFTTFTYPMPAPGVFRFLIAPMLYRGEQVGHFFIGDKDDGAEFTRADEETLVMFASQAAPVIANARLHRDEQRARAGLETLVNTSPVGVVVIDAQSGALVSFNREATRVVEGLREVDQPLEELLAVVTCVRADGREMSPTMLPLPKLLSAGETIRSEEIVLRVPDGRSVAALLNATPIHSDDGAVASFVVTLQDMTPLQGQERLQAEFLAMVSHELRTPLAAVTGAVATLLDTAGGLDPGETKQFLRIIREQSDQMRHLIGDLLDVARINTGTLPVAPEPADVQMLVDDAKTRFLTADVSTPPPHIELAPDLPLVLADRRRIVQVLSNLLFNAASYSPPSSPVTVAAARDGAEVAVSVSVSDEGRGIPAESTPELFRKFSRALGPDGGAHLARSGLRLAICKGIVEAHGGHIRAESDGPGTGARFTFTLPTALAPPAAAAADSPRTRQGAHRQVRVLAVDGDPQALRYIADTLAQADYAPIATSDPADIARLMAEHKPHLVLLDLVLPDRDGIDVMSDIKATADIPVIFLSAYGHDETLARAFDMGAADYVVKPFSPNELAARIRAALHRRLEPFEAEPSARYQAQGLSIDYTQRQVSVAGEPVELTATEYAVLHELAAHAPRVLTRNMLLHRIWGPERVGDVWLVRDVIKRLRQKLGDSTDTPRFIFTEPRVGYRMATTETGSGWPTSG